MFLLHVLYELMSLQSVGPPLPILKRRSIFLSKLSEADRPSASAPSSEVVGFEFFSVRGCIWIDHVRFPYYIDFGGGTICGSSRRGKGGQCLFQAFLSHVTPGSGNVGNYRHFDI